MKHNIKIGFLDSGLGASFFIKDLLSSADSDISKFLLQGCDLLMHYFSDSTNVPYGNKGLSDLDNCIEGLLCKVSEVDLDVLFIACNTIGTRIIQNKSLTRCLKNNVKVINIVDKTSVVIAEYINESKKKEINLWGTSNTINSNIYPLLIKEIMPEDSINFVNSSLSDKCIKYIETLDQDLYDEVLQEVSSLIELAKKEKFNIIALLCTHYPFFIDHINKAMPKGTKIITQGNIFKEDLIGFFIKEKCDNRKGQLILKVFDENIDFDIIKKVIPSIVKIEKHSI